MSITTSVVAATSRNKWCVVINSFWPPRSHSTREKGIVEFDSSCAIDVLWDKIVFFISELKVGISISFLQSLGSACLSSACVGANFLRASSIPCVTGTVAFVSAGLLFVSPFPSWSSSASWTDGLSLNDFDTPLVIFCDEASERASKPLKVPRRSSCWLLGSGFVSGFSVFNGENNFLWISSFLLSSSALLCCTEKDSKAWMKFLNNSSGSSLSSFHSAPLRSNLLIVDFMWWIATPSVLWASSSTSCP